MITLILAKAQNHVVGASDGKYGLPWFYPEDLAYYKKNTVNKINVMGHNTYKAIGKALPERTTWVLSRNPDLILEDAYVFHDINEVIEEAKNKEIMICGGVEIFKLFLPYANKVLLTKINKDYAGDVCYNPDLTDFQLVKSTPGNDGDLEFEEYHHRQNPPQKNETCDNKCCSKPEGLAVAGLIIAIIAVNFGLFTKVGFIVSIPLTIIALICSIVTIVRKENILLGIMTLILIIVGVIAKLGIHI